MKQLTCEMCGSTDLLKQDGVFVCQSCGCKYSIEEAKRMMIEGSVDVSGSTVKVDNSSFVEKYLQNARRAKEKEDWEETEKYYNLVEQNDPTNIEAIFYSAYGKAKRTLLKGDLFERQAAFKVLRNSISIFDDNYDIDKEQEQLKIIGDITLDIISLYNSNFVYNVKKNGYGMTISDNSRSTIELFDSLVLEFCTSLENIANKYPEDQKEKRLLFYYDCLMASEFSLNDGTIGELAGDALVMSYHKKIHEIDPTHEIPAKKTPDVNQPTTSSGGCYVATAVYGSYDCPQVWTLRRYRDYTLAETWHGRAFIHAYYAISPTIVKWFGDTEWFKNMWKGKLDRMVANLNAKGVQNTPYEDKTW